MSKLTKFKVRRSQFPLDFRIDNTTRDTNIKTLVAMPGTVFEEGTEETAETYNGLQLGLVHSVTPVKSVANGIDYYTCDIEGIADFGMHNELKLQMKITATNEYDQPKIKMAGNDYRIMRFDGVQLTQVLAGQLKTDNIYNLSFNGTLFILSSGMIAEKEVKALLDTTDFQATETTAGISKIATQPEVDTGVEDTKIVTSKKLKARLDSMLASITTNFVKLTQLATDTEAGILTLNKVREIAPKPDLSPYIPFSKGYRNTNNTDFFVRTNGATTWASNLLEMWNNNVFMGAFHTNSYNSFYKVPNRNGGNWNRLIDEHDLLDVMIKNQWKVIFDGVFGVQGGVVASLPEGWSDCLIYYRVYSAAVDENNNSSMLITSSEKGGRNLVHYNYGSSGGHEIKINVNAINQVVLVDRYGDAVINKVLYKNNK